LKVRKIIFTSFLPVATRNLEALVRRPADLISDFLLDVISDCIQTTQWLGANS